MRTRSLPRLVIVLAMLATVLPSPSAFATSGAAGVAIRGVARDFETGAPLSGALVRVVSPDGTVVSEIRPASGTIDATLPLEQGAEYRFEYSAPGYASDAGIIRVAGDVLDVDPLLVRRGVTTAVQYQLRGRLSVAATGSQPSTIRVYRASLGRVDVVDFDFYCKHVLPKEWIASWRTDSLRAGATAVKTYAWYWVDQGGKWPGLGADVKDTTADQVYDPNTSDPRTDAAVDAVRTWRMVKSGSVFESQYVAGAPGQDRDPAYPTRMTQWGTKYWADLGCDWQWIVRHYYDPVDVQLEVAPSRFTTFARLAGADRYATAVEVSRHAFSSGAPAAVIAFGGDFPDALCAAPLAKAWGGPVLLTPTSALPASVIAELTRLAPSTVFVIGSKSVVSSAVEGQLASLPSRPSVTRLGGDDRFDTAARVSDALAAKAGKPSRVVVANGYGFADALSAAPLAAAKGWPILLTRTGAMPAFTAAAVSRSGATASLVVGSDRVVSLAVFRALPSATRAGGDDRYATCAQVVDFAVGQGCGYGRIGLATGVNFPDALSAGPLLAADSGLLFLAPAAGLPVSATSRIAAHKMAVGEVDTIGSAAVVPEARVDDVKAALR